MNVMEDLIIKESKNVMSPGQLVFWIEVTERDRPEMARVREGQFSTSQVYCTPHLVKSALLVVMDAPTLSEHNMYLASDYMQS